MAFSVKKLLSSWQVINKRLFSDAKKKETKRFPQRFLYSVFFFSSFNMKMAIVVESSSVGQNIKRDIYIYTVVFNENIIAYHDDVHHIILYTTSGSKYYNIAVVFYKENILNGCCIIIKARDFQYVSFSFRFKMSN